MTLKPFLRIILIILFALMIPIIPFALIGELPGDIWLSSAGKNNLLFGLYGGILLTADVLLPIPSSIIGTLLAARLGFVHGWLWTFTGMTIGHIVGYGLGRLLPGRYTSSIPDTPSILIVFLSRPVPVLAEAMAITAGATRMRLLPFTLAIVTGDAIYALVLAANGATLLPDHLFGIGLILPMALPVASWMTWKAFQRNKQSQN